MKLQEMTFDQLKIGDECVYMNEFGIINHVKKVGEEQIVFIADNGTAAEGTVYYTGMSHKVYKVVD